SEALAPPKPNEFDSAYSNDPAGLQGSRTISNLQAGSGFFVAGEGGSHCPRSAIKQTAVSTAPAAPSRWPMPAFVELTFSLEAPSPAQRLIAAASELSFNGVPVPCALI